MQGGVMQGRQGVSRRHITSRPVPKSDSRARSPAAVMRNSRWPRRSASPGPKGCRSSGRYTRAAGRMPAAARSCCPDRQSGSPGKPAFDIRSRLANERAIELHQAFLLAASRRKIRSVTIPRISPTTTAVST